MKILVIDDKLANLEAARRMFGEKHDLTVCGSHREAQELLDPHLPYWDVVLSDHNMPVYAAASRYRRGEMMMVGWQLVLIAAKNGAKYCAVVTEDNHHKDVTSAVLDELGDAYWSGDPPPFTINGAIVGFWHDPNEGGEGKGWDKVLDALLGVEPPEVDRSGWGAAI